MTQERPGAWLLLGFSPELKLLKGSPGQRASEFRSRFFFGVGEFVKLKPYTASMFPEELRSPTMMFSLHSGICMRSCRLLGDTTPKMANPTENGKCNGNLG